LSKQRALLTVSNEQCEMFANMDLL
jgi:hypothetical protein